MDFMPLWSEKTSRDTRKKDFRWRSHQPGRALRAMTIWAAKAGFEEHLKGSLEPGNWPIWWSPGLTL